MVVLNIPGLREDIGVNIVWFYWDFCKTHPWDLIMYVTLSITAFEAEFYLRNFSDSFFYSPLFSLCQCVSNTVVDSLSFIEFISWTIADGPTCFIPQKTPQPRDKATNTCSLRSECSKMSISQEFKSGSLVVSLLCVAWSIVDTQSFFDLMHYRCQHVNVLHYL